MAEALFQTTENDSYTKARNGRLELPHGRVETPVFMPVGTNATVKAMTKDGLEEIGFSIILANTYHLYLRPGPEVIEKSGGLHGFSGWDKNYLTDSGGFQVYSLSGMRKISEEGVQFKSHLDGAIKFLSPEDVVEIQTIFQSDILMQLDVCTAYGASEKEAEKALALTKRWAERSKAAWLERRERTRGLLFPIVQGNFFPALRRRSAEEIASLDLPGIAIGGLSVGEPFEQFKDFLAFTAECLPVDKPHYLMGIGTPEYILEAVENGMDMFDCVFPTRTARNGLLFTLEGPISIKKAHFEFDDGPIDRECPCKVCREYSRSYLRHLFKSNEILYAMLASWHNLAFLQKLMQDIRCSIRRKGFSAFKADFLSKYQRRGV